MTADPPGATGPLRVLIADDHAVVRAACARSSTANRTSM